MDGEFNTYLQIAGHLSGDSGDFNTVPEVRSLRWTGTKSLQHVKEKEKQHGRRREKGIYMLHSFGIF